MLLLIAVFAVYRVAQFGAHNQLAVRKLQVPSGFSGRLLYTYEAGLWWLDLSGGNATQIVAAPGTGHVLSGRWSADGKRVAWSTVEVRTGQPPLWQVSVAAADGSSPRTAISGEGGDTYQNPVWDPDGQTLYILHTAQNGSQAITPIERLNLSTKETSVIFDDAGQTPFFDVSADGHWLVVTQPTSTGPRLTLVDLPTGTQREMVAAGDFSYLTAARFDPASQKIIFSAAGPNTSPQYQPSPGGMPALSMFADLLRPVVAEAHGLPQDIWSIPVSNGPAERILVLGADDPVPAWSPDGTHLAILSASYLSVVTATGGEPDTLLTPGSPGDVDWTD